MFYVATSRLIPSVLALDTTRAQANARAGWNARRYGVTVSVNAVSSMPCFCGKDVPALDGAVADVWGLYCNEVCLTDAIRYYEIMDEAAGVSDNSCLYYDAAAGPYDYDTSI